MLKTVRFLGFFLLFCCVHSQAEPGRVHLLAEPRRVYSRLSHDASILPGVEIEIKCHPWDFSPILNVILRGDLGVTNGNHWVI